MKRFLASIVLVAATLGFSGCGSDNPDSNGQLLLTVLPSVGVVVGGGIYSFVATATYTAPPPPSTTSNPTPTTTVNVSGVPITFTAKVYSANGTLQNTLVDQVPTNSLGLAVRNYDIVQTTQAITVDVTASTGGLSYTMSAPVPALTPTP